MVIVPITKHAIAAALKARRLFFPLISSAAFATLHPTFLLAPPLHTERRLIPMEIASDFKEWFRSRNDAVFDLIYDIINSHEEPDGMLSCLNLNITEKFVVMLLKHHRCSNDVLPCLKLFDWAARQPGYHHTQATYHAIFKILSRAKLMSVIFDWLESFSAQRHMYRVHFHDTLIIGYAVAGKVDVALRMLVRMRFQGLDLSSFAYHVLLNSLVEERLFKAVETILKQVSMRGYECPITCCIRIKSLCRQGKLDEAKDYLRELQSSGYKTNEHMVVTLVDSLCKQGKFEEAHNFVEECGKSGHVLTSRTYGIIINDLVEAGKIKGAIDFLKVKKTEGYIPDVFTYNKLICCLLRQSRLEDVYDLLVDMRKERISPNKLTMNTVLCFFCKAGMVEIATELYNFRLEIGISINSLTYNHFIIALCRDDNVDEACKVLEESLKQGYFPSKRTFYILADKLCSEKKLDKMSRLMDIALQKNVMLSNALCNKYVLALSQAGRAEEGYLIVRVLNKPNYVFDKKTVYHLINELIRLNRGDLASELLVKRQKKGPTLSKSSYHTVFRFLCENQKYKEVLELLEMLLTGDESIDRRMYNYFIDGVGHSQKPELAQEVLTRMVVRGIEPKVKTKILMLRCFLKSGWYAVALNYFDKFNKGCHSNLRMYNTMIMSLCQAQRSSEALEFWKRVRDNGLIPRLESYEKLVKVLCSCEKYDMVVNVLNDLDQTGHRVSSFICNVLMQQSLRDSTFEQAWAQCPWESSRLKLQLLVHAFSGKIRLKSLENLDELIEGLYPVNLFTYNMWLRGLHIAGRTDLACVLFNKLYQKGLDPNQYTYDIMLYGFCKQGWREEAEILCKEMNQKGFYPAEHTCHIYENLMTRGV